MKQLNKTAKIIIIVIVALFALGIVKNFALKMAVEGGVRAVTGLPMSIGKFNIGIFRTLVDIRNMRIYNPKGFDDRLMLDMPAIYVDYNLLPLLKGKVYIDDININLKEFVVVKKADGTTNLDTLKALGAKKEEAPPTEAKKPAKKVKMPEIQIDNLELKVGKVILKDYSKGETPSIKEFDINLNEKYENIQNVQALASLIIFKALFKTSIAGIANIDLSGFKDTAANALSSAKEGAAQTAEKAKEVAAKTAKTAKEATEKATKTMNDAGKKIGGLLPFGSK